MEFFLIGNNTNSFVSWFLSSEELGPNIGRDPAGFKVKHQIPERPDSRKYLEIRFNFLRCSTACSVGVNEYLQLFTNSYSLCVASIV